MRAQEMQQKLGITKNEFQGLQKAGFTPEKKGEKEKNVIDYTEKDLDVCKKILVLRRAGLSIADRKKMQEGNMSFLEISKERKKKNENIIRKRQNSLELLSKMMQEGVNFETLDTDYWWSFIKEQEAQGIEYEKGEDSMEKLRENIRDMVENNLTGCLEYIENEIFPQIYDEEDFAEQYYEDPECYDGSLDAECIDPDMIEDLIVDSVLEAEKESRIESAYKRMKELLDSGKLSKKDIADMREKTDKTIELLEKQQITLSSAKAFEEFIGTMLALGPKD